MQLSRPGPPPPPPDLSSGLAARAAQLGQRPAVSVLSPRGRAEQGFVTLAQWAAKGAHLLEVDHLCAAGSRVLLDVPPGWPLAAVAHAVWWTGASVRLGDAGGCDLAVVHEGRTAPDVAEVLWVGDAVDGSPAGEVDGPVWALEVQAFPDHPPACRARADGVAVEDADGRAWTHAELVAGLAGGEGPLGLETAAVADDAVAALVQVAGRPAVTGAATVVVDGVDRVAAGGDGVRSWWGG